ncbi:glycoside hydrolase family 65 protein [Anaerocolumna xylanovorans]|uniref:Hypothetical glycosyl hydrolase n=1 Tax=Anaerocolumna xylanovorans DSM 12503 TaxID=1121345 RepID=A0A1M7XX10_9FIRM|nr:glycosyl hydrolase family 65 protein [Anaerocolumna xylanovorans]SHO43399.1 hypothetical glycosyl hydrolase [Anaerocolumna xylanovorans DSM 12503]
MTIMDYKRGSGEFLNWVVTESAFDSRYLGKCESIFCQGNGYMGLRAALEEQYVGETRGMFVTGTFNKFDDGEVSELPNFPDITKLMISIGGHPFGMDRGTIKNYERTLNLKNGEVTRSFHWTCDKGDEFEFRFRRMVSMENEHVIAAAVEITPVTEDIQIEIESGIDGTVTNTGSQHFSEGAKRIYENRFLEMISETTQSHVLAAVHAAHKIFTDGKPAEVTLLPIIDRRVIRIRYTVNVKKGSTLRFEKISAVHTTRDLKYDGWKEDDAREDMKLRAGQLLMDICEKGYDRLLKESERKWEKVWNKQEVKISSRNDFDQLALRFAIYHLNIMVKKDDSRVGIGAKALSGEGYKGHSFWDTEIFILPYFMLTQSETARTLLEYRYKCLKGARRKAIENGYEGAMYPWESAWIEDGEVTPLWGAADVVTGETLKILTGLIEQHITADVAYAVWQYYIISRDEDFMERYGYEIILDTAKFWTSRLEWDEEKGCYGIKDVIGPDEYKEHVDNNAYTNHLAFYNMKLASKLICELKAEKPVVYTRFQEQFDLEELGERLTECIHKLYCPLPEKETGIIPQFDGFFDLKSIDLTKYKKSSVVGTIYNDYNMEQINSFQVLKQGDVVVLLYLLDDLFSEEIKRKNYLYYEERTLHDSSLSKATHSVLANDLGLKEEAYHFFEGACCIDLGTEMKSSNSGIHSASVGGIWQAAVMGFGGVRVTSGQLRINPSLPEEWNELEYRIVWRNSTLVVTVTRDEVKILNQGKEVTVIVGKKELLISEGAAIVESI